MLRLALVLALTTVVVAAGVLLLTRGDDPADGPSAAPSGDPTPSLAELDTTAVTVARAGFCSRLDQEAVAEALGAAPTDARAWEDGERARLGGGPSGARTRDIAHEFGCAWSAGQGAGDKRSARAWVFAPPVTPGQARDYRDAARSRQGCRPQPDAPAYGKPSVALVCGSGSGQGGQGGRLEASYRGLFGDAWLVCSVSGPGPRRELVERTSRWCAATLQAASAQ